MPKEGYEVNRLEETSVQHSDENDAVQTFLNVVKAGSAGSSWLGIYVEVHPDGSLKVFRTTWKFPTERFLEIVARIAEDLAKENVQKEEPTRLPFSDYLSLQKKLQEKLAEEEARETAIFDFSERSNANAFPRRDDDPVHTSTDNEDAQ